MLAADMAPQYTLVIDLQDTLVHQTWDVREIPPVAAGLLPPLL